jgi:O-antigen/teichoic acid export membrane protein
MAGPATLGQVHLAFRLVDTVRDLTATALWRLMLPSFAERQHDQGALCGTLDRTLRLTGLVMFPLWGAVALTARPLVALLLGPVWAASADATLPLIALAAWTSLAFPSGVAAVARGATGYTLAANLAATVLTLVGAALLHPATPLAAALIWVGAQLACAPYVVSVSARVLRLPRLRPLRAGLRPLALAAVATAAAFLAPGTLAPWSLGPLALLALMAARLGVLAALYLAGAAWLLRDDLHDAAGLVGLAPLGRLPLPRPRSS